MKRIIIGLLALIVLPISIAQADVESDLAANLSIEQILANAVKDGIDLATAVAQISKLNPEMAAAAVVAAIAVDSSQTAAIVAAAKKAAPEQAGNIDTAQSVALTQASISDGTGDVEGEAAAAGNPNANENAAGNANANANAATPAVNGGAGFAATPAVPSSGSGGGGSPT